MKRLFIISAILMAIGSIIFGSVMTMLNWNFTKLSTTAFENNSYEITEDFKNIKIVSKTANITIVPCYGDTAKIECYEQVNMKHSVSVKDNTLLVAVNNTKKWYEYLGFNFNTAKITLYLPRGEYGNLTVQNTTGDISLAKDFSFKKVDISVTTGDISLQNVSSDSINLSVTTGSISLNEVIAEEKLTAKTITGSVSLEKCDAADIYIKCTTGNISGTLLSEKVFEAKTTTGKIDLPETAGGGKCKLVTTTGNIKIKTVK